MPASKPTKLPRWATGATAQITEPNEGKKDLGHQVAERPPAQYFNWLFNLIHSWLAWLGDFEVVAHTWTALQTFAAGIGGSVSVEENLTVGGQATVNSALTVTGEVDHSNRLKSGAPINATDLKLVSQHPGYGTGAGSVRRYVSGAGATLKLYEVVNAISEEGVWSREVAGQPAFLTELGVAGARMLYWPVDEVGTAFSRELSFGAAGVKWTGTTTGTAGANPPKDTPITNELRAANVCKAWATCEYRGDLTPKQYNVLDAINVSSLAGASGEFRLTFAAPMADANYAVMVTLGACTETLKTYAAKVVAKTETYCDIRLTWDAGTVHSGYNQESFTASEFLHVQAGTSGQVVRFDVHVFGRQNS